jgi:hypothetical protein
MTPAGLANPLKSHPLAPLRLTGYNPWDILEHCERMFTWHAYRVVPPKRGDA